MGHSAQRLPTTNPLLRIIPKGEEHQCLASFTSLRVAYEKFGQSLRIDGKLTIVYVGCVGGTVEDILPAHASSIMMNTSRRSSSVCALLAFTTVSK